MRLEPIRHLLCALTCCLLVIGCQRLVPSNTTFIPSPWEASEDLVEPRLADVPPQPGEDSVFDPVQPLVPVNHDAPGEVTSSERLVFDDVDVPASPVEEAVTPDVEVVAIPEPAPPVDEPPAQEEVAIIALTPETDLEGESEEPALASAMEMAVDLLGDGSLPTADDAQAVVADESTIVTTSDGEDVVEQDYPFDPPEAEAVKEALPPKPEPKRVDIDWGVVTSSSGRGDYAPVYAVDDDPTTRWSSNFADGEWWQAEFHEARVIGGLRIKWETAFGEKYAVKVSDDGVKWKTVYDVPEGDGNTDLLFFEPVETKFVRIEGRQRGTGWGYSIWELHFFSGDDAVVFFADSFQEGHEPEAAMDGRSDTTWKPDGTDEQQLIIRLPERLNIGGLEMQWGEPYAKKYAIEISTAEGGWSNVYEESNGNGGGDYVFFQAHDLQQLRIRCIKSSDEQGYALAELQLKGGEEAASPLRNYKAAARDAARGIYPRWLRREQEFWTITGVVGDDEESLLGETGSFEPYKGGFCVQPFLFSQGELISWADVDLAQSLEHNMLPIPSVTWGDDRVNMAITAVPGGPPGASYTVVRYQITNPTDHPFEGRLALAIRPVQLNPIWQRGGMSPIREIEFTKGYVPIQAYVNGRKRLTALTPPTDVGAVAFAGGDVMDFVVEGLVPNVPGASHDEGMTSGVLVYDLSIEAGGHTDIIVGYPLHEETEMPISYVEAPAREFEGEMERQTAYWSELLNRFQISIPDQRLINMMKSNIAYILLNRDGPWMKPGPRNYNHAWIRDGAMTSVALLRMGLKKPVEEYIHAFSEKVADSGWVPFIILEEGNPVAFNEDGHEGQEYDSQGQYPFLIRQYYDFTGDEALAREKYPAVVNALNFARELRKERMTDEFVSNPEKRVYFGILPESNSHEGYFPAKHSYWDDFWVLRGLKDGAYLADTFGYPEHAAWMRKEEAGLREALLASIAAVIKRDGINNIPGCAELGDFDATSTAIAVMACDESRYLPQPYLNNTFDGYFSSFSERLQPGGEQTFTPYEVRNADAFIRMGDRDRALTLLDYFTNESSFPPAWNHLAEVVHARYRSPSYIGDMPHTWVGSGYISAVRTLFAYEEEGALILGAGLPASWMEQGVEVKDLPTQYGTISYEIARDDQGFVMKITGQAKPPKGFTVRYPQGYAPTQGAATFQGLPAVLRLAAQNP